MTEGYQSQVDPVGRQQGSGPVDPEFPLAFAMAHLSHLATYKLVPSQMPNQY